MNPIHHDVSFAQRAGYPSPLAVGMLQAGVLSTYVTDWLGPENLRAFSVQFREPAWPGDVLTYAGTIVAAREGVGERLMEVEMTCTRQTGGLHLTGSAVFALPL